MSRWLLGVVADSGPVLVLAGIAAAGSFTHIRETATEHGQGGWMAWAVAVCIDLTCVMAARERQRDKRTHRATVRLTWPTVVLVGGIVLSLAANLAQADPTAWGWITAATPAGAFLVAVSMLERRAAGARDSGQNRSDSSPVMAAPPSFGRPSSAPSSVPEQQDETRPGLAAAVLSAEETQTEIPIPASANADAPSSVAAPLVEFARRVATEHQAKHGRPITRDALRARLGVSNQLASDLLRHVRTETA